MLKIELYQKTVSRRVNVLIEPPLEIKRIEALTRILNMVKLCSLNMREMSKYWVLSRYTYL